MKTYEKTTLGSVLGKAGEDAACRFLTDNGHVILDRNCRQGHLEIDIVSLDRLGVHFVEVKSRREPVAAAPQESVTITKQRRIAEAASRYLRRSRDSRLSTNMEVNFDVIAVTFGASSTKVEWFPNAYFPMFI